MTKTMRGAFCALVAMLLCVAPPAFAQKTIPIGASSASAAQEVVPASPGQQTTILAGMVMPNASGTVKWVYGTGTNCGTGTTNLTDAMNVTAQAGFLVGDGSGPMIVVPAGQALCIVPSATSVGVGYITYTQR